MKYQYREYREAWARLKDEPEEGDFLDGFLVSQEATPYGCRAIVESRLTGRLWELRWLFGEEEPAEAELV